MKRRMLSYYRVSSEGQEDNTSIGNQKQAVRRWAQANDIELVNELTPYVDIETASGKQPREAFEAALQQLQDDVSISGLVVFDLDRYFRNCGEGLRTFEQHFKNNGSQLVSIRQNFDTSTDEGWFAFGMFLLVAEYELRKISRRMRSGIDAVRAEGYFGGGKVPYGYRSEHDKETDRYNLVPDKKEYPIVEQMKQWKSEGMSYCGIAKMLNDKRVPGKSGKRVKWESKGVARILQAN